MLDRFLAPAIAISQALSFRRKFLLIFIAALLPGLWLLSRLVAADDAGVARDREELDGVSLQIEVPNLTAALARHRALVTQWLPADTLGEGEIVSFEAKADRAFEAVKAKASAPEAVAALLVLERDWNALKHSWRTLPMDESLRRHGALIASINAFSHAEAGRTGLLLDPDASSYYLIVSAVDQLPVLKEHISQMRSLVGILRQGGEPGLRPGQIDYLLTSAIPGVAQRIDNDMALMRTNASPSFAHFESDWKKTAAEIEALRAGLMPITRGHADPAAIDAAFKRIPIVNAQTDKAREAMLKGLAEDVLRPRLAAERTDLYLQVGSGMAIFLVVAYLIGGFARDIARRAEALEANMQQVADGDLTTLIATGGRDELSRVIASAHRLAERLRDTMADIRRGADELKAASDTIASLGSQVAAATAEQSDAAAQMAAAVEELTVSIGVVANDAGSAHEISDESGRSSVAGAAVVQETVNGIQDIATRVREASGTVSSLGNLAGEIAGIVDVIKDIADMTNLLALNAAIEAARAGEAGAGFAIVADAVRKLAERSGASTQDIAAMVTRIQEGAQSAVAEMQRSVQQVEQGVEMAGKAGRAIGAIRDGSGKVVDVVSAISNTLREQAHVAEELARNVESIAQMSEDNRLAAVSSAATAEQLRALAGQLEVKIGHFKLSY